MRKRAELLPQVQPTHRQENVPESGTKLASKTKRTGVADRFPEPAVQKSLAVDLTLVGPYDPRRRDGALCGLNTATQPDANTLDRLRPVPGIGAILSVVWRDAIHDSPRCPRGQDVVSSCRLVPWAKEAAGKSSGTSGAKLGHASRQWAFSAAAVWLLRPNPAGQTYLARVEHKQGPGQAWTGLAPQRARAVEVM
jgi:hypothetical protein